MTSDPLRVLWDALHAHGCRPHGREHDFRACCPGHRGANPESLHVFVGADGRAVVWCFAHNCAPETITAAIELTVADLFPDGHHRARRLSPRPVRRAAFRGVALDVVNVLYALEEIGETWTLMLTSDCPYCGAQGAWLRVSSPGGSDADCGAGCDAHKYVQALLGRLNETKETA